MFKGKPWLKTIWNQQVNSSLWKVPIGFPGLKNTLFSRILNVNTNDLYDKYMLLQQILKD